MCDCYAIISDRDPRSKMWKQIVPDGKIPLKHPLTRRTRDGREFYEGDPSRLSEEQKRMLAELVSEKFGIPKEVILNDLRNGIMPILADNVIVHICEKHARCML